MGKQELYSDVMRSRGQNKVMNKDNGTILWEINRKETRVDMAIWDYQRMTLAQEYKILVTENKM